MKDRIIKLMQTYGLNNVEFADRIGISTSSLSHILNERNKPSLDVVLRIHKAYPALSLQWLLCGEGSMIGLSPEAISPEQKDVNESKDDSSALSLGLDFSYASLSESVARKTDESAHESVKYVDQPAPQITEIRIFFDNGTYQVFKPEKN